MRRILRRLIRLRRFLFHPHFLLCFGLAWLITNGWAYLGVTFGGLTGCTRILSVSTAWLTLLWLPFTPEKIVTAMLAVLLLKLMFPEDEQTLKMIQSLQRKKEKQKERQTLDMYPQYWTKKPVLGVQL